MKVFRIYHKKSICMSKKHGHHFNVLCESIVHLAKPTRMCVVGQRSGKLLSGMHMRQCPVSVISPNSVMEMLEEWERERKWKK